MRRQFYRRNVAGVHAAVTRQRAIGAEDQLQGIIGLRQLPLSFGYICTRAFDLSPGLFQRQDVRTARHQLLLNECIRLPVIVQRIPRDTQLFIRQLLVEIALRHVRDEQDMHRATGLFTGEIVLSVGIAHVLQLAEEIEFIAKRKARVVLLRGGFVTFQPAAVRDARGGIQLRITIRIRHIELRPGFLDLQAAIFRSRLFFRLP